MGAGAPPKSGMGRRELPRGQAATGKEAAPQEKGQKGRLALLMSQPHSLHFLEPSYKYSLLHAP